MNFLQRMTMKMQQFMVGRYGSDRFSLFLSVTGVIFAFLGNFKTLRALYFVGLATLLDYYTKMFSKINILLFFFMIFPKALVILKTDVKSVSIVKLLS